MSSNRTTRVPHSLKTKAALWVVILLAFGITAWMQLVRDEPEQLPQGFYLPPAPSPIPEGDDEENGLYYLSEFSDSILVPASTQFDRTIPSLLGVVYGKSTWDSGRMERFTYCAPAILKAMREALNKPAWHESRKKYVTLADDSNMAQIVLLAQGLSLLEQGKAGEALTCLELDRQVDIRRAAACVSLEQLVKASQTASWVNQAAFTKVGLTSNDYKVLQRVWKLLSTPVVSRDQFLTVLAEEYRRQRSLFAGEEVDGARYKARDFLPVCCTSTSDALLVPLRYKRQATCNRLAEDFVILSRTALLADPASRRDLANAMIKADHESTMNFWSRAPNRAGQVFVAKVMQEWLTAETSITKNEVEACANAQAIVRRRASLGHESPVPLQIPQSVGE